MPASNECIDWAGVRAQVTAGQLKWTSSDPGTGTLPGNRVNTAGEFNTYIRNTGTNPYASNRAMEWSAMQTYRQVNISSYAIRMGTSSTEGYMETPATSYTIPTAYTIMFWLRVPDTTGGKNSCVWTHLTTHVYPALVDGKVWSTQSNGTGSYLLKLNGYFVDSDPDTGDQFQSVSNPGIISNGIATGVWNHIAIVFNGSNQIVFYVNGAVNKTVAGGDFYGQAMSGLVAFGRDYRGLIGCNNAMGIDIDEPAYYNTNLSQSTIQARYQTDMTANTTNGIVYYRLENSLAPTWGSGTLTTSNCSYITDTGV